MSNVNYSDIKRNEKSRVHWLVVKSYLLNSGEDGSNWGTRFLTLLKGQLFIIEVEKALLFSCSQTKTQAYDCDTLSTFNFVMILDISLWDLWNLSVLL